MEGRTKTYYEAYSRKSSQAEHFRLESCYKLICLSHPLFSKACQSLKVSYQDKTVLKTVNKLGMKWVKLSSNWVSPSLEIRFITSS